MARWLVLLLVLTALSGCSRSDAPVEEAAPEPVGLSKLLYSTIVREAGTIASSVDGVPLAFDVWRPDTHDPVPVILVQSPYWSFGGDAKDNERPTWYIDYFVPRGYAVALGEMRGTRDSGGCWDFGGELDQQDGADMVEGLAAMPWSNGRVGMLGQSHVGMSQVAAGVMAPPSLKTIVPIAAVTDWYRYLHYDGAPYVLNRGTPPAYFAVHASPSTPETNGENAPVNWLLTQAQTVCADNVVHLSQSAELDGDKDAYWQERDLIAKAGNTRAAVFLVHGFLDENVKTDHFLDYWEALPADIPKKAWFGQWHHEHPSYVEWREDLHRWFDLHLKGMQNGILDEPRVTVQDNLMHNRTEANWPVASSTWRLRLGDAGELGPSAGEGTSAFRSVPGDDRGAQPHDDRLGRTYVPFITEPLAEPVRLTGAVLLNLTAETMAPDARWNAALFDVAPDGSRDEITRSYMDARHRNGPSTNEPPPLLAAAEYPMRFFPRDHVLAAGHRLELVLFGGDTGCNVPPAQANPYSGTCEGTGILPVAEPTVLVIHHDETHLDVPVQAAAGPERPLTELEAWLDDPPV